MSTSAQPTAQWSLDATCSSAGTESSRYWPRLHGSSLLHSAGPVRRRPSRPCCTPTSAGQQRPPAPQATTVGTARSTRTTRRRTASCSDTGAASSRQRETERSRLPSANAAAQAAKHLRSTLDELGLRVRAGIHVGDVEAQGSDLEGLSINIAARTMDAADPGEILATESARLAMLGSPHDLTAVPPERFNGLDGDWQLYRV